MDYKKLREFDKEVRGFSQDYLSMIAVGSIVTGDPFIKGRSDRDIVLIFNKGPSSELLAIENLVKNSDFDDSYFFTPIPQDYFGLPDSKYAFSNVFRSKTLFGEDFVKKAKLPLREQIKESYVRGLTDVSHQLFNQIINSSMWAEDRVRDHFWKQFKHTFMYLAIREYSFSEDYPKTRAEVAQRLDSREVNRTLEILHSIDNRSKEEIVNCAKNLRDYLDYLE